MERIHCQGFLHIFVDACAKSKVGGAQHSLERNETLTNVSLDKPRRRLYAAKRQAERRIPTDLRQAAALEVFHMLLSELVFAG
jgi:hypothetical protein